MTKEEKAIVNTYLLASSAYYAGTTGYVKRIPKYSDPITREYIEAVTALRSLLDETIS